METPEQTDLETGEVTSTSPLSLPLLLPDWKPVVAGLSPEQELAGRIAWSSALARCYADVANVKKDGYNDHFKYHFPTADAIFSAAKSACAKNGLAIVPMMGAIVEETGEKNTYTRVAYTFAVIEQTSGYTVAIPWTADALDNLDKGINKSLTSALKSFLRILFLISDGDDPDAAAPSDSRTSSKAAPKAAPAPKAEPKAAPAEKKEKTPEQLRADELLKGALPGLTSEDERVKGEAKYVLDQLSGAAKGAELKLSEAILLIAGERDSISRVDIEEGALDLDDTTSLIAAIATEGGQVKSFADAFAAVQEGYKTPAGYLEWLAIGTVTSEG